MSRLHVRQIEGYLRQHAELAVDMSDCTKQPEPDAKKIFLTRSLAALATSSLVDIPLADLCEFITDGSKDGGIDLIYFEPTERTLYLVQSKWHSDGHGSIDQGDALKFIDGVRRVLDNDLDGLNQRILDRAKDVESAVLDASARFVLVIAHTGQESLADEVAATLERYVLSQNDTSELMTLQILNQGKLHKTVAAGVAGAPISVEVQLSGWGQVRDPQPAYYGQVCAADVASWVEANGSRLFEANLRHFLGSSPVNADIVSTLLSRPDEFWYFNNGITAIATSVNKKPIGGRSNESGIFECGGFCVVNGAQTVGSIHAAAKANSESVSRALVNLRIIEVGESRANFGGEITRYTNTQNAIEKRDFVALDPEQERLRQELQFQNVDYAYKAGTAAAGASQRFDLMEATVALSCAYKEVALAVQAKREIGKLWEDISRAPYKQLFNKSVNGPHVWEMVQISRLAEGAIQAQGKLRVGRERLICVHGNRFIQWLVFRDLDASESTVASSAADRIPGLVAAAIDRLCAAVKMAHADAYPASLFKNLSKCKGLADIA